MNNKMCIILINFQLNKAFNSIDNNLCQAKTVMYVSR